MSLASPYIESYYVADGVTTSFAFGQGFTALSEANVKCIIYFEDDTNCVPTFTVDMTTGYITIITLTKPDGTVLTVPPAGSIVRVFRDTPEQQNVTASQLQNYTAKQLERIFDSVVAMIQELSYLARRKTVRLTETQRDVSIEQLTEEKDQGVLFWDFESGKIKAADFGQDEIVKSETVDRLVYIQSEGKIYFIPKGTTTQIPIGSATVHNELSGRNAPDCHPESAITNLTTHLQELRDKDTAIEAKADTAVETANQAYSKAETAEGVANSAYEKSVEAERVANTFDGRLIQAESDASDAKTTAESTQLVVDSHVTNKSNPHEVTKAQVGLGNVDNTSDLDKPISTATQAALNAQQEEIDALSGRGRFLSLWNCVTGLPETDPETESPYVYHTGDYYIVGTVSSATPAVNYKPSGSSYVFDPAPVPSSVVETGEVSVNDTYVYDGENWILQSNAQKEVSFSALAGSPYDNTNLSTALNSKQNTLTAGTNIEIINDVISATAQESFFRGRWNTWAAVPSSASLYPADYTESHTPTEGDYMVVLDASGYVREIGSVTENSVQGLLNENNGNVSPNETWRTSDFLGVIGGNTIDYTYTRVYTGAAGNRCCFYDSNKSFIRSVSVPGTTGPGTYTYQVVVPANAVYVRFSYIKSDYDIVASYDSVSTLSGGWRFGYHGVWEEDNKNGWLPEYQIEDVLPTADSATAGIAKLYTTTGSNTDGSMTQSSVTTALSGKQDTLTAGSNISIVNNVISATAQESFFRGKFLTWSDVPTDPTQYYPNYKDETTPTNNDYMIVEDSSSYVKPGMPIQIYNEPMRSSIAFVRFVFGATDITLNHYIVSQRGEEGVIIGTVGNQLRITYASAVWKVTPLDVPVIVDGVEKPINEIALFWSYQNPSQETLYKEINFAGQGGYVGTWRFGYQSDDWDASGKNGWEPEYQVEDVLPIADSSTAGIAKLYTTTGSNTDGAIDQNGTTTAINTAVSTHNTVSNAHSNIRGTANGLATLDGNAKVPLTQINDALLGNVSYQGLWNAATNDPYLIDPSGGLPAGYNALEYIDLNGGYIDTLISFDSSTDEIQYDFNLEIVTSSAAIANRRIFGAASGDNGYDLANSAGSLYNRHNWESGYFASAGSNQSILNNVSRLDSNTFKMVLNRTNNAMAVYVNGSLNANINVTQGTYTTNTVYIGTCHLDSGAATNICPNQRYQYFKITKDGVLAGDFRPAKRLADGVIGFFDVVSNTFFTNLGSGTFTGGGSIEIPKGHYYITSVAGTQFGIHFEVGDWVISTGSAWSKVDNTDAVSSVEGRTGNVTVINDSASTGATTYTWSADKLTTEFGSLGTAAYTASTDYATAAQGAKADTALQPADVVEYTANEVETLWNSI